MHCVGEYPTKNANLQLNQISLLRSRYPKIQIGYSAHEEPDNFDSIKIAIAKGAVIFEKHVGINLSGIQVNDYTATPLQVQSWLESASETFKMCGALEGRSYFTQEEITNIRLLQRGVFAKRHIKSDERIENDDIFLAMPAIDNQITSNELSKYTELYAQSEIEANEPIINSNTIKIEIRERVYKIVQHVKEILKRGKIVVPGKVDFEISHHYGLDKFYEFGVTMLTIVNREYCKKLLILLAGQKHPEQYHKQKEETFHILYGDVLVNMNGIEKLHNAGDVVIIERGIKHSFWSKKGAVIEEISLTHRVDDSYYTDDEIMINQNRKTLLTYWMEWNN